MGQLLSHSHTNKVLAATDDNPANPYFLSEKHCNLLQRSWPYVDEYGPEKIGAIMFKALFKIHPESFEMFSSFSDDPKWETSVHFKHHCRVVVAIIGSGIKTLKTPEVLCPHLEFLGFQHKLRDIHIVHFTCLGEEMLKALEGALKPLGKDKWNDEIKGINLITIYLSLVRFIPDPC